MELKLRKLKIRYGGDMIRRNLLAILLITCMMLSSISGVCAESLNDQTDNSSTDSNNTPMLTGNTTGVSNTTLKENTTNIKSISNSSLNESSNGSTAIKSSAKKSSLNDNSTSTENKTVSDNSKVNTTINSTVTTATPSINENSGSSVSSVSLKNIEDAANRVASFIEKNSRLPNYVTIGNQHVSMPNFLNLLVNAVININKNKNNPITLGNFNSAPNPSENFKAGNINKSEYIAMAKSIASFMNSNGKAPNYASSSLGKIGYKSLIYMYSKVLRFKDTNSRLPNYVKMGSTTITNNTTPTNTTLPTGYQKYLKPTTHCQSNNAKIIAKANSIISNAGATTTYAKSVAIYNWVKNHITYSFYSNTKYGAIGTLNMGKGNCCDKTNLLTALLRASGIPARYVHGYCKFSNGHWYGHIWAQVYVNGKWYTADTTSSRNSFGTVKNWNTKTAKIYGTYTTIPC
jgi:hypothetical protein